MPVVEMPQAWVNTVNIRHSLVAYRSILWLPAQVSSHRSKQLGVLFHFFDKNNITWVSN